MRHKHNAIGLNSPSMAHINLHAEANLFAKARSENFKFSLAINRICGFGTNSCVRNKVFRLISHTKPEYDIVSYSC